MRCPTKVAREKPKFVSVAFMIKITLGLGIRGLRLRLSLLYAFIRDRMTNQTKQL